jgi:hypothetical protein
VWWDFSGTNYGKIPQFLPQNLCLSKHKIPQENSCGILEK